MKYVIKLYNNQKTYKGCIKHFDKAYINIFFFSSFNNYEYKIEYKDTPPIFYIRSSKKFLGYINYNTGKYFIIFNDNYIKNYGLDNSYFTISDNMKYFDFDKYKKYKLNFIKEILF